ncbi:hypothetical protein CPB84DRAFT_1778980 [Gymnopilus junonius]|uniref:Uncharacterized protein n=1 Tax=Gymnopilus junonius TaxID=109634 RepID=A0A9P5NNR9_GYMJU|nr:hypothetical protein CPB84DRAFT_1778980 [Gymnopilus junonius]
MRRLAIGALCAIFHPALDGWMACLLLDLAGWTLQKCRVFSLLHASYLLTLASNVPPLLSLLYIFLDTPQSNCICRKLANEKLLRKTRSARYLTRPVCIHRSAWD